MSSLVQGLRQGVARRRDELEHERQAFDKDQRRLTMHC